MGYDVSSALTGACGIETAREIKPDLVILDLNLTDMYGEDLCRELRKIPGLEKTGIIFLTGSVDVLTQDKLSDIGADGVLIKPFESKDCIDMIQRVLERRGSL